MQGIQFPDFSNSRCSAIVAALASFILCTAVFLLRAERQIGLGSVPGPGDEAEYDLLAMELAAGNGFRFDYDNAEWRRPYLGANDDGSYDILLSRHGAAPTTYRPPLFPAVVAGLYTAFGRSFLVVRVFNCVAMGLAGGFAAWIVARRIGFVSGLLFGILFSVVEHRARYHAGLFLTESLATLLATVLALVLIRLIATKQIHCAAAAGVLTGLAILNRPLVALWFPFIVALIGWSLPQRRLFQIAVYSTLTIAVILPWSIRNSLLLGHLSLLGTHGQQNLAAAYSDEAVRQKGIWYRLDGVGFFPEAIDDSRPGIDRERARAAQSQHAALEWMKQNPLKVPFLMLMRVWQLWQPRMHWDALILGLAFLGYACWSNNSDRRIVAALLFANTAAVGVTWSVGGRFLVPLLPIIHLLVAHGFCIAVKAARAGRRQSEQGGPLY